MTSSEGRLAGRRCLVTGATGAGKSFLMNFLVTHAQKYDPITTIFDLGGSYQKLTRLLGGSTWRIGLSHRDFTINPFCLEPTPEHLHFLFSFVRVLLQSSGQYRLSMTDDRDLYEAIENLYALDLATGKQKWQYAAGKGASFKAAPSVHAGAVYVGDGDGVFHCVEAATGKVAWKQRLYLGSLILLDGHLVVLSQVSGEVRVVEATPAAYREKAKLAVLGRGGRADAPPSFADGRLFVRNDEELAAVAID